MWYLLAEVPSKQISRKKIYPVVKVAGYGWLSGEVEAFPSWLRTKEDIVKLCEEVSLTLANYSGLFITKSCSATETMIMRPQEEEAYFIYLYKTFFSRTRVTIPFDSFEVDIFNVLNVIATQLHPHSWAVMQTFRVLCHCLHMETTAAKFLHHYSVSQYQKSGWISLSGIHKISVLRGIRCFFALMGNLNGGERRYSDVRLGRSRGLEQVTQRAELADKKKVFKSILAAQEPVATSNVPLTTLVVLALPSMVDKSSPQTSASRFIFENLQLISRIHLSKEVYFENSSDLCRD
ncbi:hypothetical protein CR513_18435, partial [Mucuna pruriens]